MSELVWQDPPPSRSRGLMPLGGPPWSEVGEALAARPGEWAIVHVCRNRTRASVVAHHINSGRYPELESTVEGRVGAFEAVSREVFDQGRVYARWLEGS